MILIYKKITRIKGKEKMKKKIVFFVAAAILLAGMSYPLCGQSAVHFAVTSDILEILDQDYQGEIMYVTTYRSAFAFRLGYYRTIEDSKDTYPGNTRHWELGGRWRYFLVDTAPNLLFIGAGFDNRPKINTITPLGELGFNFTFKPFIIGIIAFGGYEVHVYNSDANRFVKGIEIRVGFGL